MAQIKKDYIKQTIIDNAIILFVKNGYHSTTMRQIARASKISVGNIYKYFKDKAKIFDSIITPEFLTQLNDVLVTRTKLNVKRQYKKLTKEELNWFNNTYYPFFISNANRCVLLSGYSHESDYNKAINALSNKIMSIKKEEYLAYGKISISAEFIKLSTIIIMSNVELYVRILSSENTDNVKIKLLKLADDYHVAGIMQIHSNLIKGEK